MYIFGLIIIKICAITIISVLKKKVINFEKVINCEFNLALNLNKYISPTMYVKKKKKQILLNLHIILHIQFIDEKFLPELILIKEKGMYSMAYMVNS